MAKVKKKEIPNWHSSHYRGEWDTNTGKMVIKNEKPIRCPYCGKEMDFATPHFYESHQSDYYWFCIDCGLRLGNKWDFSKEDLDRARKRWRKHLQTEMNVSKSTYERLKKLYNAYGRYYTPEEKRDLLIESIEEHEPKQTSI